MPYAVNLFCKEQVVKRKSTQNVSTLSLINRFVSLSEGDLMRSVLIKSASNTYFLLVFSPLTKLKYLCQRLRKIIVGQLSHCVTEDGGESLNLLFLLNLSFSIKARR